MPCLIVFYTHRKFFLKIILECDGDVFSHSDKTYKKHSHFMELLKNTKKKLRRTEENKRKAQASPATSLDATAVVHHHHSSHL